MHNIKIEALLEVIRDCEQDSSFIDCILPDLQTDRKALLKKHFPQLGHESFIGFVEQLLPSSHYINLSEYITKRYVAKVYPFWVNVKFDAADTALITTMKFFDLSADTIFTEEHTLFSLLPRLSEKKVPFQLEWSSQDTRYADHKTGTLRLLSSPKNDLSAESMEEHRESKAGNFTLLSALEDLQNLKFSYLDTEKVIKLTDINQTDIWVLNAWHIDQNALKSLPIAECGTKEQAENLKGLIEALVSRWEGPLVPQINIIK